MNIGRVVGTVVSTRKDESLVGTKLLIAQPLDLELRVDGPARVMVDTVGAGVGELVIYAAGAAARNAAGRRDGAIDMAVVGIIDHFDTEEKWIDEVSGYEEGEEHFE
ncbi:MAG: EutN/CcmL family microcompartment protein [Oscillospiraceae bacterium]|nr:EutN/CcmL family microcompartment protein [Oscillospiraceae bacterium]